MKRKQIRLWSLPSLRRKRGLILMAGMFAIGAMLGCCWSVWMNENSGEALRDYLQGYLSVVEVQSGVDGLARRLWHTLQLPLLVVLLRFASLGVLLIPPLLGIKGFLLSFSISSFVKSYGWKGEAASLAVFGPSAILEAAVLLYLAAECWEGALRLGSRQDTPSSKGKSFFKRAALCFVLLIVEVALEQVFAHPIGVFLRWLLMAE